MARTSRTNRAASQKRLVDAADRRLQTVQTLIDEALDACDPYVKLVQRMRRLPPGSAAYLDLLSDIAVAAEVLSAKTEQVESIIDRVMETIPD